MKLRSIICVVAMAVFLGNGQAAETLAGELPRIPPKEPAEAVKTIRTRPGFCVELVACEPLIRDPVAIDFDENGRMFVIELPDYNHYALKEEVEVHSVVKRLVDTSGDGLFDQATVYLDNLRYPTAVACYDGGVFIGDAPDLLFAKDTNGDGKADTRQVVVTGFGTDRAGELHLNSLRWGLDNRFHMSCSLNGGSVRAVLGKDSEPTSIGRQGFVFDPRDPTQFEPTSGGGQHGMSMDDWGRKYVCWNGSPMELLMYEQRYLARNPYVEAPPAAVAIAPEGKLTKLFRVSPPEPWRVARTRIRAASEKGDYEGGQPFGFFTAATGVTIYRGDAWPQAYRGDVLVGEPANNLVFRARTKPQGLELEASRGDAEAEFLASTDIWFRPIQFANAPDGTLYVIDMYRELIEGAAFLPPELVAQLDPVGGTRRGRIYRIAPQGFQQPKAPALGDASTDELVVLLEHTNGWHRDTAARLLYQRQDPAAVDPLIRLASNSSFVHARAHAMWALDGLGKLSEEVVLAGLSDENSQVRRQAVRLAERLTKASSHATEESNSERGDPSPPSANVRDRLVALVDDPDPHVRYQLAFTLGEWKGPAYRDALVELALRHVGNSWIELAVHSSLFESAGVVMSTLARNENYTATEEGRSFITALCQQIGRQQRAEDLRSLFATFSQLADDRMDILAAILQGLQTSAGSPLARKLSTATSGRSEKVIQELIRQSIEIVSASQTSVQERVKATRLLAMAPLGRCEDVYSELLEPTQPVEVLDVTVATLAGYQDVAVARLLLDHWPSFSPRLRRRVADVLVSRSEWTAFVLDAIAQGRFAANNLGPAHWKQLTEYPDLQIRKQAQAFSNAAPLGPRTEVLAEYRAALKLDGNLARGKEVFTKNCAACHNLDGTGFEVGPDLRTVRNRSPETILVNVLAPNQETDPRYANYTLLTTEGRVLTGMIADETATSVTLKRGEGASDTILRLDIDQLKSTGVSLMPEGLEKEIDKQAMADLIAYIRTR